MTPQRARQALCGFLVLATAVVYNALFLQSRSVPGNGMAGVPQKSVAAAKRAPVPSTPRVAELGPDAGKAAPEKRTMRIARFKPDWAQADVPAELPVASPPETSSVDTIRAIQRELRQRGYGALVSDGLMRPVTRAAIMAYEFDNGLPLTAHASESLLQHILLGGPPPADGSSAGRVGTAEAEAIIKTVQQALAALGYQPGAADGRLGPDTKRAIGEFEVDHGLIPKGRISADVLVRLGQAEPPKQASR